MKGLILNNKIKKYRRYQKKRNVCSMQQKYSLCELYNKKMGKVMASVPKNTMAYDTFMNGIVYSIPFINPLHNKS